ncbi:hypothetical protein Taro_027424 [Colocasia esculenta]|uniref:Protein kinase domain-containing protein n=1 Tax=Colocasia esculenta TaxID=4460 RepID=A0A843V8P0_COLES|nr:hypothetical protein [Colocasia esculenta]
MEGFFAFFLGFLLLGWGASSSQGAADPALDKRSLLDFIRSLHHGRLLNWSPSVPVCGYWVGVTCSADGSRVVALRLPGVGLSGQIPQNTLGRLTALQTLSLRSNNLSGAFPADLANLTSLTDLHLQFNNFSGPLPADFSLWRNLTVVDLSFNAFSGSIPSSLSNLTQLTALNLSNNSLSGKIPDLHLLNLKVLNLSGNHLTGSIPESLRRFPSSSFSGNNLYPLNSTKSSPSPSPHAHRIAPMPTARVSGRKLSESVILGIIVGGSALGFVMFALLLLLFCSRKSEQTVVSGKLTKGDSSPEKAVTRSQDENNTLVFFEGCTFAFDLEDLLRASAEVLGKGTFGTAYKAVLEDSTTVMVKRLKEVAVGKREFEQQMEIVGRLKHENVAELRAYYYSKDEKLMVYDFFNLGSVSSMLHGIPGWESWIGTSQETMRLQL